MGPQYQATIDSYAASPQATQNAGNQTLGKSMEQSPVHDGFGTRSSMYDNGMDVSAQPAPVSQPPQPQNQPSTAGVAPSWAQQQKPLKKGGRAKRADGGGFGAMPAYQQQGSPNAVAGMFNLPGRQRGLASAPLPEFGSMANQPQSLMTTGDTLARYAPMYSAQPQPMPMQGTSPFSGDMSLTQPDYSQAPIPAPSIYTQYKQPATGPSVYQQGLGNEDFLNTVYRSDLGVSPDAAGKQYWLDLLKGGTPQKDIEAQILGTPEAQQYQSKSNEDFLNQLYSRDMMREPDVAGKQFWQEQIAKGTPLQDIEATFMQSPEYKNRAFLDQAYQSALGRPIDEAGYNYWRDKLVSGEMTRPQIAQQLASSQEAQKNLATRGLTPDQYGQVDPFVASYNARVGAAQDLYGTIAQQNYLAAQQQKAEYQAAAEDLSQKAQQKLSEAEVLKQQQDEAAAAAARRAAEEYQRNLLLLLLMQSG